MQIIFIINVVINDKNKEVGLVKSHKLKSLVKFCETYVPISIKSL